MSKKVELTGKIFGRLTVIRDAGRDKRGNVIWECQCSCENKTIKNVASRHLQDGGTLSCGCLAVEKSKERNLKHGMKYTRIYSIFRDMNSRCYNKNRGDYKNYGGRGIKICDEWFNKENGFINFYNWSMKNGYDKSLTIDRINTNGNYEPNNCRWTNLEVQGNNRNNNVIVEFENERLTLTQWGRKLNINQYTLFSRYRNGKRDKELFREVKQSF